MATGGAQRNPWAGCGSLHHAALKGRGQRACALSGRRDVGEKTVSTGCAALHPWQRSYAPSGQISPDHLRQDPA